MTSLNIVLIIICASELIAVVYTITAAVKKSREMLFSGLIMLFTPPAGTLYYFGQYILLKILRGDSSMQLEDIGFSKERRERIFIANEEEMMQAVPLEELFLVSSDAEKRRRLLVELKKENIVNFAAITKAFDNDDPETSHYAAAAVTNAKAGYENEIRELDIKYNRDRTNLGLVRTYMDYVHGFLGCGILEPMEIKKYGYLYLNLIKNLNDPRGFLTEADYANAVEISVSVGDFTEAERLALMSFGGGGESGYLNLLKVFYYTNRPDDFFETLEKLKRSDISLSDEGLTLVRFFIKTKEAKL